MSGEEKLAGHLAGRNKMAPAGKFMQQLRKKEKKRWEPAESPVLVSSYQKTVRGFRVLSFCCIGFFRGLGLGQSSSSQLSEDPWLITSLILD